ncbi:unnamed protein product [Leuciscus chuanchicus]
MKATVIQKTSHKSQWSSGSDCAALTVGLDKTLSEVESSTLEMKSPSPSQSEVRDVQKMITEKNQMKPEQDTATLKTSHKSQWSSGSDCAALTVGLDKTLCEVESSTLEMKSPAPSQSEVRDVQKVSPEKEQSSLEDQDCVEMFFVTAFRCVIGSAPLCYMNASPVWFIAGTGRVTGQILTGLGGCGFNFDIITGDGSDLVLNFADEISMTDSDASDPDESGSEGDVPAGAAGVSSNVGEGPSSDLDTARIRQAAGKPRDKHRH